MFFLALQFVTGIFLAMFYNPNSIMAYASIMEINNEIYYGWWMRYLHANGASLFFLCTYVHLLKAIYYGSFVYPRQALWMSGIILLILMIMTAFFGYILPWGQMSFWGAMVITNLLSTIPLIGADFIFLLWGGFSIQDATLDRFYALHFIFPILMLIVLYFHLFFLHEFGSNNPLGVVSVIDNIFFSPYYVLKDFFSLLVLLSFVFYIVYKMPDLLGHPLNYEKANPLITPSHIVPEWYFLFFYAILRSVTNKFLGFLLMLSSIFVLFFLSKLLKKLIIRSSIFKPWHVCWFWIFVAVCLLLGWIGSLPVMSPFLGLGLKLSIFYFTILLIFFPLGGPIERLMYDTYVYISGEFDAIHNLYFYFRPELVGILGFSNLLVYVDDESIKNVCPDI